MKPLWWFFGSLNLPSDKRKPIKFEICSLFGSWKQINQFLVGWFESLLAGLAQTFHDPSVSQNETPLKVFWLSQFTFQRKGSNKIWNLDPIRLLERNLPIFWGGADLESCCQVWPTHSPTLQCHKIKLVWEALLQANYLSDKQPNKIWNLDPIRLLERNWPIFLGLSWKTGLIFGPDFA